MWDNFLPIACDISPGTAGAYLCFSICSPFNSLMLLPEHSVILSEWFYFSFVLIIDNPAKPLCLFVILPQTIDNVLWQCLLNITITAHHCPSKIRPVHGQMGWCKMPSSLQVRSSCHGWALCKSFHGCSHNNHFYSIYILYCTFFWWSQYTQKINLVLRTLISIAYFLEVHERHNTISNSSIILYSRLFAPHKPHLTKDSFVFLYVMAIEDLRGQCARDKILFLNRGPSAKLEREWIGPKWLSSIDTIDVAIQDLNITFPPRSVSNWFALLEVSILLIGTYVCNRSWSRGSSRNV